MKQETTKQRTIEYIRLGKNDLFFFFDLSCCLRVFASLLSKIVLHKWLNTIVSWIWAQNDITIYGYLIWLDMYPRIVLHRAHITVLCELRTDGDFVLTHYLRRLYIQIIQSIHEHMIICVICVNSKRFNSKFSTMFFFRIVIVFLFECALRVRCRLEYFISIHFIWILSSTYHVSMPFPFSASYLALRFFLHSFITFISGANDWSTNRTLI